MNAAGAGPSLNLPGPGPIVTEPKMIVAAAVVQATTTKKLPILGVG